MMYTIKNGLVYSHRKTKGSKIDAFYCHEKKIKLTQDKKQTLADGVGTALITATWQKFNTATGTFSDDASNVAAITFDVAGIKKTVDPINGQGELEFSSLEPGLYEIKTTNLQADNSSVVVEVK